MDENVHLDGLLPLGTIPNEPELLRARIAELEAQFVALTDGLDAGVIIHGPATEILFGNARAEELLGASMEQLRGKTAFDPRWKALRRDGSDFPAAERPTAVAFRTKLPQRAIVVGIHRPETDDRVWLLVSAIPQCNPDGTIQQVVATFTNITAQLDAERQIHSQAEQILELSVPFIAVAEGVALMPVVGILDAKHANRMLDVALTGAAAEGARVIILDMTGVPAITRDSIPAVARIASACKLVGTTVLITGLRAEPARMLAQFECDLPLIKTFPRLHTAMPRAMELQSKQKNRDSSWR